MCSNKHNNTCINRRAAGCCGNAGPHSQLTHRPQAAAEPQIPRMDASCADQLPVHSCLLQQPAAAVRGVAAEHAAQHALSWRDQLRTCESVPSSKFVTSTSKLDGEWLALSQWCCEIGQGVWCVSVSQLSKCPLPSAACTCTVSPPDACTRDCIDKFILFHMQYSALLRGPAGVACCI